MAAMTSRTAQPAAQSRRSAAPQPSGGEPRLSQLPPASPPRRKRWFLCLMIVVFVAWMAFLIAMAWSVARQG